MWTIPIKFLKIETDELDPYFMTGWKLVTEDDFNTHREKIKELINRWDMVQIDGDRKIVGSGYGYGVEKRGGARDEGHSLIVREE